MIIGSSIFNSEASAVASLSSFCAADGAISIFPFSLLCNSAALSRPREDPVSFRASSTPAMSALSFKLPVTKKVVATPARMRTVAAVAMRCGI